MVNFNFGRLGLRFPGMALLFTCHLHIQSLYRNQKEVAGIFLSSQEMTSKYHDSGLQSLTFVKGKLRFESKATEALPTSKGGGIAKEVPEFHEIIFAPSVKKRKVDLLGDVWDSCCVEPLSEAKFPNAREKAEVLQ
ncbi:hypothetical protein MA16_Dca011904 [Dendrobium catenatum]|uniref:Uncharacterized protein n=1 Tax=Dendrobium catenatum TaxID=906689 RepID=A0A2I0W2J6_9ASPA|nr:hypothetical protein MA16_Dca011904 [Dendrobium catenatum]